MEAYIAFGIYLVRSRSAIKLEVIKIKQRTSIGWNQLLAISTQQSPGNPNSESILRIRFVMPRLEPLILPRELCPGPVANASFEEAQQHLVQEAEKRKKEWQNQMERLRMQLQQTSLRPTQAYRRSIECNINVNDRLHREFYSPSHSPGLSRTHQFRDSFNQRLVDARRLTQDVISEDDEISNRLSPENPGFCLKFDMSEYRPEHITVQAKGHILFIQASCEEYKNGARTLKEYSKRVDIPRDVDSDQLISRYSSEGVLTIEVPVCPHPSPAASRDNIRQV